MFKTMIVKSIGGGIALAILLLSSTGLKAAVTHSGGSAMQQQQPKTRILSGTVLDAVTNEPVIGAAVQVRGRQGGEITDLDGMFTIEVPSGGGHHRHIARLPFPVFECRNPGQHQDSP